MIEVEIDKTEIDKNKNGKATLGKIKFCKKTSTIPFKSISISTNDNMELKLLKNEKLDDSPREFFIQIKYDKYLSLFGRSSSAINYRNDLYKKINDNLTNIPDKKNFNFVYTYFLDSRSHIDTTISENIFDMLDSQYNDLLVLPLPPSISDIKSVRNLIHVFKNRKSLYDKERPIMGVIPKRTMINTKIKLIEEYIKNDINIIGIDFYGQHPTPPIINPIIAEIEKKFKQNYFIYAFNLPKAHYIRGNIRPISDILNILYGVNGFNNQRFSFGGFNWSTLTSIKQQNKIDNIRFRILDNYGEYNKESLSMSNFNFDKRNETNILNRNNYDSIYNINKTNNDYKILYDKSKKHNWILTHKEIKTTIKEKIDDDDLAKYLKGKRYVTNDVTSILSSL